MESVAIGSLLRVFKRRNFDLISRNLHNPAIAPDCDWIADSLVKKQRVANATGKGFVDECTILENLSDCFLGFANHSLLHFLNQLPDTGL